jgi:hypothetical protein
MARKGMAWKPSADGRPDAAGNPELEVFKLVDAGERERRGAEADEGVDGERVEPVGEVWPALLKDPASLGRGALAVAPEPPAATGRLQVDLDDADARANTGAQRCQPRDPAEFVEAGGDRGAPSPIRVASDHLSGEAVASAGEGINLPSGQRS